MVIEAAPFDILADSLERETWLKARLRGVGASESPVLMGASKYSSPIELWGIKTGRLPEDVVEENERMLWGQRLEPLVAEEYERKTGRQLARWGKLLQSKAYPYILATPDYRMTGSGLPVEIKTTDMSRKADWRDGAPLHVVIQCQQQMLVTGAKRASVGVLAGGNTFMWCDVERDETLITEIVGECGAFWRYVMDDLPPPVDGTEPTTDAIRQLWPKAAEGESIVLPADAYDWVRTLEVAEAQLKEAKATVEENHNKIKVAMGNAEMAVFPSGDPAFSYKTQKRRGYAVSESTTRVLRRLKSA